jgi:aspartyl-tRNA(Asn)/glutamyl-tRNA(Gln) amidotransferase subunit A
MYLADIYTVTASLAGICGMSAPCEQSSQGLAIGAQILESTSMSPPVLRAAQAVESAASRR